MKSADDVKAFYESATIETNPAGDNAVLADALQAGRLTTEKRAVHAELSFWRSIMNSRMTKITAAAAVVLAVAVGITLLRTSSAPVYGMTDVLELIEQAKTLHIEGWRIERDDSTSEEVRLPFEYWYDLENGRYRMDVTYWSDGDIVHSSNVCDGEYVMTEGRYRPAGSEWRKTVNFEKVDAAKKNDIGWLEFYQRLCQIEGFQKVGRETIAGRTFDIWQGRFDKGAGDRVVRYRISTWVSPATAEMGRIRTWLKQDDAPWLQTEEYSKFERNILLPAGIFRTEAPVGYEIQTPKEAATVPARRERDVYDYTQFDYAPLNYWVAPVFVLPDGSFLACWQGVDAKESRDQSKYFEDLRVGADLPRLPVEVYALSPEPNVRDVRFVGFHLAHTEKETEKGRRWYEWSLFVPDKEPADPNVVLMYRPHYRLNVDRTSDIGIDVKQVIIPDPQKVETEEAFNTLVLSAMAQRSDDGVAPEHVTYENVLSLVEQIRASLIK